jgi:hypothetical protein
MGVPPAKLAVKSVVVFGNSVFVDSDVAIGFSPVRRAILINARNRIKKRLRIALPIVGFINEASKSRNRARNRKTIIDVSTKPKL